MSNQPPYRPAALVVVEILRVVVAVLHATAFTALSPASAAVVPISRMSSCAREAGHCSKSPRISLKLSYVDECDHYRAHIFYVMSTESISCPNWESSLAVRGTGRLGVLHSLGDFPIQLGVKVV